MTEQQGVIGPGPDPLNPVWVEFPPQPKRTITPPAGGISMVEAASRMRLAMERFAWAFNGGAPNEPTPIYDQLVTEFASRARPSLRWWQRLGAYLGLSDPEPSPRTLSIFDG